MRCSPHEGRCCHRLMRALHFSRTETIRRVQAARLAVDFRRDHRQRDRSKPCLQAANRLSPSWAKADLTALKCDFRFTPEIRLKSDIAACSKRAIGLNRSRGSLLRLATQPTG